MGRICNDIDLRQTQSGVYSCRFTVAVNRPMKNKQTGEYESDFITCTAWRTTAEFISRNFHKGKMIAIEGSLRTGKYQDKKYKDVTHYTTDILVDNVYFCGDKQPHEADEAPALDEQRMNYGDLSEFEEIIAGEEVPF